MGGREGSSQKRRLDILDGQWVTDLWGGGEVMNDFFLVRRTPERVLLGR